MTREHFNTEDLRVIKSQVEVRPTVHVSRPIIVEEDWEQMKLTERRR